MLALLAGRTNASAPHFWISKARWLRGVRSYRNFHVKGSGQECPPHKLPASGLQHLRFVQGAYCQALHGAGEVFADFK